MPQYPSRAFGPTDTNTQAPFIPAMAQGYQPDRPQLNKARQLPQPLGNSENPINAPFTSSMTQGYQPRRYRQYLPRIPVQPFPPVVDLFSPDMVQGSVPFQARLFRSKQFAIPPLIDWTESRIDVFSTTPDLHAPFLVARSSSVQTINVALPDILLIPVTYPAAPRLFTAPRLPQPLLPQIVLTTFLEIASRPDSPRLFLAPRIPLPIAQTTFPELSAELEFWAGSRPDRPRVFLGPRIGLPISQTTHVAAPDTASMWIGLHPDQSRIFRGQRIALPTSITDSLISPVIVVATLQVKTIGVIAESGDKLMFNTPTGLV